MPTVDAVPVVRCRECKYWKRYDEYGGDVGDCKLWDIVFEDDFFCADGERKDGAE